MKTKWVVASLALAWPAVASQVRAQPAPVEVVEVHGDAGGALHAALSRYAEYGFSGVLLVEIGGERVLHAAYGWADRDAGRPMTTDVPFNIQSITKPVVASLALELVADGVLDLDDELGSMFPDLPPAHRLVTLRQLLSHTSGLVRDFEGYRQDRLLATREDALRIFASIPLRNGEPQFAYRNLNYAVVKAMIEQATGEDFRVLLERLVLEPAASDLAFDPPLDGATPYDGMPGDVTRAVPDLDEETYAGGTLWGTAEGLTHWEHFLDAGGLFSGAWLDTMRTPVAGDYGLGWFVYPQGMLYHGGDGSGFQSALVRYPRLDLYFVCLTNVRPLARDMWWRGQVTKVIQLAAVGRSIELPPPRFESADELDAWAGAYVTGGGDSITVRRDPADGGLVASAYGPEAVSALNAADEEWLGLLRAADARSERIGRWLEGGEPPGEDTVSAEDRGHFLGFLREQAPGIVTPSVGRWEVLGSTRRSRSSIQTFVATGGETLRLQWNVDDLRLTGWGLGGDTPAAFATGVSQDGDLIGYVPGGDNQVPITAVGRRDGLVQRIRVGSLEATRAASEP